MFACVSSFSFVFLLLWQYFGVLRRFGQSSMALWNLDKGPSETVSQAASLQEIARLAGQIDLHFSDRLVLRQQNLGAVVALCYLVQNLCGFCQ